MKISVIVMRFLYTKRFSMTMILSARFKSPVTIRGDDKPLTSGDTG